MNCLLGTMHGSRRAQRGVNLCEFALVEQSHLHATQRESFPSQTAALVPAWKDTQELGSQQGSYRKPDLCHKT